MTASEGDIVFNVDLSSVVDSYVGNNGQNAIAVGQNSVANIVSKNGSVVINSGSEDTSGDNSNLAIVSDGILTISSFKDLKITTYTSGAFAKTSGGIFTSQYGNTTLEVDQNVEIFAKQNGIQVDSSPEDGSQLVRGIYNAGVFSGSIGGNLKVHAEGFSGQAIQADGSSKDFSLTVKGFADIDAITYSNVDAYGITNNSSNRLYFESNGIDVFVRNETHQVDVFGDPLVSIGIGTFAGGDGGTTTVKSHDSLHVSVSTEMSGAYGIFGLSFGDPASVNVEAKGDIVIRAESTEFSAFGVFSQMQNSIDVVSESGSIDIVAIADPNHGEAAGIYAYGYGSEENKIFVRSRANSIESDQYGMYSFSSNSAVQLEASSDNNRILSAVCEVAEGTGTLDNDSFGTSYAVYAAQGGDVTSIAAKGNLFYGAVYANDVAEDTVITLTGSINNIASFTRIQGAGGIAAESDSEGLTSEGGEGTGVDTPADSPSVISAVYAEGNGASVKLSGRNILTTYADNTDSTQLERVVWAYKGADIVLDGPTVISTNRYETSPNSLDVAVAAGTAVGLTPEDLDKPIPEEDLATVNVSYGSDSFGSASSITGDILAAYAGKVSVKTKDDRAGLSVVGNLLAGNGGTLEIDLGKNGSITGRADDYIDAGSAVNGDAHAKFFNPAFSSTIYKGGSITLNMGEGSTWTVTGQSWVTNLSGNGTIHLVNALDGVEEDTSHALHVQNLSGKHTFVVNLNDSDHSLSDMLYINNVTEGSEEQVIRIDGFEGLENMAHLDRIRFATVNVSSDVLTFVTEELNPDEPQTPETLARASSTQVRDVGFYDVGFRIESETRSTDTTVSDADDTYDGKDFNTDKPGETYVDTVYGSNKEEAQNWYLVRDKSGDSTSDGGESILATARATYWNAVEIDRLNKRLGDARHADGGTDGFWVRVRNDRIGTDAGVGDFRSRNYAYQFGYDHSKQESDGRRLFGAALDYMDGNTTYRNVEGTGATDRFGVTAYMTWFGDDGWYYDVVGKWGVLSNSFRITSDYGVLVDGDYDNHVLGASFEFGRKLAKENSLWFLEPQAQIQHVMVTEASYSTNQGTHVDQDKINSTITRLGFRIGRNFGEKQSGVIYAKADWLKEWHGHQGIKVTDATTGNVAADASIDNKGNWFDVGLGVQSPITDTTYFFADAEYVFGNDLDNTWNFNAGLRWMFH